MPGAAPSNFAISIERSTALPRDDPTAYSIVVTATFMPPRPMARATSDRTAHSRDRERWQGVASGVDDLVLQIGMCVRQHGLSPSVTRRGTVVCVRLDRSR